MRSGDPRRFLHRILTMVATSVVIGGCDEQPPEPCPQTVAWVKEVLVSVGELGPLCLPLRLNRDSAGEVACAVVEIVDPAVVTSCEEVPGRVADGVDDATGRLRCTVEQYPVTSGTLLPAGPGWYYDDFTIDVVDRCRDNPQGISFTEGAEPRAGSILELQCVYRLQGLGPTVDVGTSCASDSSICANAPGDVLERFPRGLACEAEDTVTCQPLCASVSDCPPEYECIDENGDGTSYCSDPRCSFAGSP